ncbi:MAG: cytidylate kinase family protein, partial [Syntrophomonadaceae bacterium]
MLITVSRQTGSMGEEITRQLAQNTGLPLLTRDLAMSQLFPNVASKHEIHMLAESPAFFLTKSSEGLTF